MSKTKKITVSAVFIALTVVLKLYSTLYLFATTKFGFSFIPAVLSSATLGPLMGAVVGGISDIIGFAVKQDGTYFPGFTISAIIKGILYGVFLFRKPKSILNVFLAIFTSSVLVDIGINSFWMNMITGNDLKVVFVTKLTTVPLYMALQTFIIYILFKYLGKEISKISE